MNKQELEEIKAREEAATPGPWMFNERSFFEVHTQGVGLVAGVGIAQVDDNNNARFIAYARRDIPALVKEAERLWAENEVLRDSLAFCMYKADSYTEAANVRLALISNSAHKALYPEKHK